MTALATLTPVQELTLNGRSLWLKRDDLFEYAGVRGGKVRTCLALTQRSSAPGLVTAGARTSPQALIVARLARALGKACRVHTPTGTLGAEVLAAQECGAEIIQHKAGYNSVIVARARDDAAARGWTNIPFGMECQEAVEQTRAQVRDIPSGVKRIVVPVGSGMSLAGILTGLVDAGIAGKLPVCGVVVGADPLKRLDCYAPLFWRGMVTLEPAGVEYHTARQGVRLGDVLLDSIYEAKCVPFLRDGDMLWIVGIGATRAT